MRLARLTAAATVIAAACIAPSAASAQAPDGEWTYIRKDAFKHYACKQKAEKGRWTVKTATYYNHKNDAVEMGIGAYATIARGSDENLVTSRDTAAWKGGYIRLTLRGAESTDRLWIQGSYYGPAEPWADGFTVRRLDRCD
jgi:hypothetical protein